MRDMGQKWPRHQSKDWWTEFAYFRRLESWTMHSTSSSLQFVHGAPCSTTLHRTFLALQHAHAFEALLLAGLPEGCLKPAVEAFRFVAVCVVADDIFVTLIRLEGFLVLQFCKKRRMELTATWIRAPTSHDPGVWNC